MGVISGRSLPFLLLLAALGCGSSAKPGADGGGGAAGSMGGSGGTTYSCGSQACISGQTLCYTYAPGTPGGSSSSCAAVPAACAGNATCACVCPPSSSTAIGCVYAGNTVGGSCSCTETNGMLTVLCLGN